MNTLLNVSFSTLARVERCVRALKDRFPTFDFECTESLDEKAFDIEVLFPSSDYADCYTLADLNPTDAILLDQVQGFAEGFCKGIEEAS